MALQDDLKVAIEKNLSAEVGATLKRLLDRAEEDAKALTENRKFVEALKNQVENLQSQVKSQEAIEQRILTAKETERKMFGATTLKEIVDLKEKHADEKVKLVMDVVRTVFANNQYKYMTMENGSLPAGCDQYGNAKTTGYNRTSTGEGTGAPPPPPVGSP